MTHQENSIESGPAVKASMRLKMHVNKQNILPTLGIERPPFSRLWAMNGAKGKERRVRVAGRAVQPALRETYVCSATSLKNWGIEKYIKAYYL